ncbi:unnamed protein product [Dibothriocephalus latus]|uniref:Uncharacterized protein n=1 Tax=Dibothriocephalus latus TaxID=60516 RepID=A0A3P7NMM9_DIBLA|nr:unnamed protein product [Dibothriocephalus latus]
MYDDDDEDDGLKLEFEPSGDYTFCPSNAVLQLVFFDADSRPLFVTATSGILSVDEFDDIMCARRAYLYLPPSRSLPPPPSAAFGAESPDWQDAVPSDSDEPWF